MKLTAEPRYWFYPDIGGNLKLPKAERLAAEIIRPTATQKPELADISATYETYPARKGEDPKNRGVTSHVKVNVDYILRTLVGGIRNLTVEEAGKEKPVEKKITTGAELAECQAYGTEAIINAIVSEVRSDEITDAEKKSFE
jgi:hypothetical protein